MPTKSFFRGCTVLLLVTSLLSVGCNREPTVCRVTGTVRLAGKPVPNVRVNFVPAEGRPSSGVTDQNGVYNLQYAHGQPGAQRGTHKVFFSFRPRNPIEESDYQNGKITLSPELTSLLDRYGSAETTPLTHEVKSDGQVIDISID
jgi:hypothetical protein